MEILRETAPFMVGLLLSPALMLLLQSARNLAAKGAAFFVPVLLLGGTISALNGELTLEFPEPLFAIALDSLLVAVGAVVAYKLVWKRLLAHWLAQQQLAAVLNKRD